MKNKPLIFGLLASALVFGLTCCVGIFSFAFQHHIENAGGGASVGDACDRATDCDVTAGQSCMHDDAGGFCTTRCQTSDVCAPGWVCEGSTITRNGQDRSGGSLCMRPEPGREALQTGRARVTQLTGSVPGVSVGTLCSYRQIAVPTDGPLSSRWEVSCGTTYLYGGGTAGYNPRSDPSWPPGVLADDTGTTGEDGDAAMHVEGGQIVVRDDDRGHHRAFEATLQLESP